MRAAPCGGGAAAVRHYLRVAIIVVLWRQKLLHAHAPPAVCTVLRHQVFYMLY